jgi:hypothetical protein
VSKNFSFSWLTMSGRIPDDGEDASRPPSVEGGDDKPATYCAPSAVDTPLPFCPGVGGNRRRCPAAIAGDILGKGRPIALCAPCRRQEYERRAALVTSYGMSPRKVLGDPESSW